jgi:hypothetical protein
MSRDSILTDVASEIEVRIRTWESEKAQLLKAAARIAELDEMIAGAQEELETLRVRKPELRPRRAEREPQR